MKTNRIHTLAKLTGIAVAVLLTAVTARAQNGAKGGATRLLELNRKDLPAATAPAHKPMACAMCKDEFVKRVDWTARGANKPTITVANHGCNRCGVEWNVLGHGKAKVSVPSHKCKSC